MVFLFAMLGCLEKSTDTAQPDTATQNFECATLDEAACLSASPDCGTIYGWPLEAQGDGFCNDESVFEQERSYAGCSASTSGLTVETVAGPPEGGSCWLFSSGSVPEGWVSCEGMIVGTCE